MDLLHGRARIWAHYRAICDSMVAGQFPSVRGGGPCATVDANNPGSGGTMFAQDRIRLMAESERLRTQTTGLIAASEDLLRESSTLMAAGLAFVEQAEAGRTAAPHRQTAADVLPVLLRLREARKRFMRDRNRGVLFNDVLDLVMKVTNTDLGNIQVLDSRSGGLKIVAQRGFESEFLDFFRDVRGEEAACVTAMRARLPVLVEDVATSPVFVERPAQEILLRAGVQAVQSTPLLARGDLVGMLSTHFRSRHRVPEHRLRLVDIVSRQTAQLVRHGCASEPNPALYQENP